MGSDLKQGFISSLRSAWQTLNDFARAHTASAQLQAELAIVANQIEEQEKEAQEGNLSDCSVFSQVISTLCKNDRGCFGLTQSTRFLRAQSHKKKRSLK